uniref:Cytochrome b5 heme-binding domain-containing protein n=1 Tax=Trichuris muris TaxID=70415 RepID=A0A5S6QG93_TRIMR
MFYPKLVAALTVQVFLVSIAIGYYEFPTPSFVVYFRELVNESLDRLTRYACAVAIQQKERLASTFAKPEQRLKVFSAQELSRFGGGTDSEGLYLALLGRVYNVEKGARHYGPDGTYHVFAGRDATRAFVTGDFSEDGLTDDLSGLSNEELVAIQEWVDFYGKEYKLVGVVQGRYYDSQGKPSKQLKQLKQLLQRAVEWQQQQNAEVERFPPCNSEWIQGQGGRVWCSQNSGGIKRSWVGVPRRLFTPGSKQSRCVCAKSKGPPQEGSHGGETFDMDRGDLDYPNLSEFPNCDPKAVSCNIDSDV